MRETVETNHLRLMAYLNLSSVLRKIGDHQLCEEYIRHAETVIEDELLSTDDLYKISLLVST